MNLSVQKQSPGRVAVGVSRPSDGASDPLDQLIWYLGRAYYTYVGLLEKMLDEAGVARHVQPGMGHILFTLFAEDDLTIKEIAKRSQLANSTLTGLLNRMEANKLVERRRDSEDGRLVRVRLTRLAREVEGPCRDIVARLGDIFQDRLGDVGVRQSREHLGTIIEAMRDEDAALSSRG